MNREMSWELMVVYKNYISVIINNFINKWSRYGKPINKSNLNLKVIVAQKGKRELEGPKV